MVGVIGILFYIPWLVGRIGVSLGLWGCSGRSLILRCLGRRRGRGDDHVVGADIGLGIELADDEVGVALVGVESDVVDAIVSAFLAGVEGVLPVLFPISIEGIVIAGVQFYGCCWRIIRSHLL